MLGAGTGLPNVHRWWWERDAYLWGAKGCLPIWGEGRCPGSESSGKLLSSISRHAAAPFQDKEVLSCTQEASFCLLHTPERWVVLP